MKNANPNLIAVGDNCLDAYLNKGFVTVGGNALNVAVQWKRLGYGARYFGALAPDQEADIMLGIIDDAGLARDDVEILQGKSAVTLLTDDAGERHFLLESLGVGENYIPDTQRYQELLFSDWTHLGTNSSENWCASWCKTGSGSAWTSRHGISTCRLKVSRLSLRRVPTIQKSRWSR